jgi:hypothetical protein
MPKTGGATATAHSTPRPTNSPHCVKKLLAAGASRNQEPTGPKKPGNVLTPMAHGPWMPRPRGAGAAGLWPGVWGVPRPSLAPTGISRFYGGAPLLFWLLAATSVLGCRCRCGGRRALCGRCGFMCLRLHMPSSPHHQFDTICRIRPRLRPDQQRPAWSQHTQGPLRFCARSPVTTYVHAHASSTLRQPTLVLVLQNGTSLLPGG